jgi:predicted dehydrogenase
VRAVAEVRPERREYVASNYPGIQTTSDYRLLLMNEDIEAVVIVTHATSHAVLVREALLAEKHVFVEKPLAFTVDEAEALVALAEKVGRTLMMGHVFMFNAAVNYLKRYITEGHLGRIYYINAQRLNLGRVRKEENALWSLAPHDISILLYLLGHQPLEVSARGMAYLQEGVEDVTFITLVFPDDVLVSLHVSWLSPNKVRQMTVVGSEKMVVYDDVLDSKIQIFDKGVTRQNLDASLGTYETFGQFQLMTRAGDIIFPKIEFEEPLRVQAEHFLECVATGATPLTDGRSAVPVIRTLEAAQASLRQEGAVVRL